MITWNVAAATPPPSVMRAVSTHLVDTYSDRKYPSLADALVKLRLPASLDGKIPSEVTRRGVPAAIIRSVIDLSRVDHERDVLRMLPDGVRPLKELASSRVIG